MTASKIEWTDRSDWNPIRGCSRVSAGCENCYAERQAHRFSGPGKPFDGLTRLTSRGPQWTGEVRVVPERLDLPLCWTKPARVFAASMSDLFHEDVPDSYILAALEVMANASSLNGLRFQVLTKRAQRMREVVSRIIWGHGGPALVRYPSGRAHLLIHRAFFKDDPRLRFGEKRDGARPDPWKVPPGIHLGVSVENQAAADERIPHLLATPAAVRFVSAEPLLGDIYFGEVALHGFWESCELDGVREYGLDSSLEDGCEGCPSWGPECAAVRGPAIDWVIVGGESGPNARPCRVEWVRSIVAQCQAARVPVFVKQLGAWREPALGDEFDTLYGRASRPPAFLVDAAGGCHCTREAAGPGAVPMVWCGGKQNDPSEWPEDLRVRQLPGDDGSLTT